MKVFSRYYVLKLAIFALACLIPELINSESPYENWSGNSHSPQLKIYDNPEKPFYDDLSYNVNSVDQQRSENIWDQTAAIRNEMTPPQRNHHLLFSFEPEYTPLPFEEDTDGNSLIAAEMIPDLKTPQEEPIPQTPSQKVQQPEKHQALPSSQTQSGLNQQNEHQPNEKQAQAPAPSQESPLQAETANEPVKSILINFNNVGIIEYLRFISRITNKNFVFDENDLQFNVTIVSEEPTSIENIMAALIQELRIHDLALIEQGNNLIIHRNPKVNSLSKVVADDLPDLHPSDAELITQVFRLNTLEPEKAAAIIRPLVSSTALVEFITDPNHLIVTDIITNVQQIGKLLKSIDAPNSGLVIGQYAARMTDIQTLLPLVQKIMAPISQDHPLIFVPYEQANSIFIVSSPFLVERSISILQHLDLEQGKTRIIDLKQLKFEQGQGGTYAPGQIPPGGMPGGVPSGQGYPPGTYPEMRGAPGREGMPGERYAPGEGPHAGEGWQYGPGRTEYNRSQGIGEELNIYPMFIPIEVPAEETPEQRAERERCQYLPKPTHVGITEFEQPVTINRHIPTNDEFLIKPVNVVKFYIHKMQYRRGDIILSEIRSIGESLRNTTGNDELLATIDTAQFLEDAKAIVIAGTAENIEKIKELIEQIDIPLRQVYIEMLILQTTVADSLNFSCNFATRFGGGNQAGSQGFLSGASPLQGSMDTTGVTLLGSPAPNPPTANPFNNKLIPDPTNLAKSVGFNLGVMGQKIIHKGLGLEFNSIGALVKAEHDRNVSKLVLSPKIITEDNVPAYIFVGINTPYQTQSVANNNGNIITNNFEFRDVGTSLQVTPHIMNSNLITLEIIEERSEIASLATATQNSTVTNAPTTNKSTTKTTVNVPDGYFVIISGMLERDDIDNIVQVPCLGSIPLLGGGFKDRRDQLNMRNLMIFLRPQIIDTDEQIQNITRHAQDTYDYKTELPKMWVEETEGAMDFFNVRRTMNTDDQDDPEVHQFAH